MDYEVTVVDGRGQATPLLIQAGGAATVGALIEELARTGVEMPPGAALFLGAEPLPPQRRLADTPLGAGARLTLAPSTGVPHRERAPRASSNWEAAVVCGPASGITVPMPDGARPLVVGRAIGADLVLDDAEVSRRHAELRLGEAGEVVVTDAGSRNGTGWRGSRIDADTTVPLGDLVRIGESMIAVRGVPAAVELDLDPGSGVRRFNRPPRIPPVRRRPEVAVPARPPQPRGMRFPLATVLLPLVLAGVVFALLPGSWYYLIFLGLSPLMVIGHVITERRGGRREYREKLREYETALAAAQRKLSEIAEAEERASREALPDPAAVVRIATGPTARLFERRPDDPDFGLIRVGLTDRSADVRLTGAGAGAGTGTAAGADGGVDAVPMVYAVPAAVDLGQAGVVGLAGPRSAILPVARAMLAQVATLHAPNDLGIVLFTGRDRAPAWEWASWLPHTLPHRADVACRRMIATDREQAEARIAELHRILAERRAEMRADLRGGVPPGRRMLLVLDGARRMRELSGLPELLADGPAAGIYALCLDETETTLPDECRATVVAGAVGARVRVAGLALPEQEVLADSLSQDMAGRIAQALAPVRVLGARFGDDGDLPGQVRYLELAGLGTEPRPEDILARWAAQPAGRSTTALIGADATGPVVVDLRRDGPHALIAGTSGAGKSELLQTLVASLALGNTPDALNLVLVDYKGGSAFADCRELPHCVGMVTDLDGQLADRALASLTAELRRRETILAEAEAKDIEDYWARTGGRLPRLVIVIDEFATLVEEIPDFVPGVVGIGMRGRSLGVHVVLATQRPGGVVNADLRANVNLRLCLRVTRPDESTDVIDVPDAARISRLHPGRAYLRTGHSDLSTLQCARIGWPRETERARTAAAQVTVSRRQVTELGWLRVGPSAPPAGDAGSVAGDTTGDTDLTVLVSAVRAAAERLGVTAPPSPWLPPLPERVTVALGPAGLGSAGVGLNPAHAVLDPAGDAPACARIGLADLPASQAQPPYLLDLERAAPLVVAGMARSGRSTALRTLAASLAAGSSPADVHLYVLDYGSRALASLEDLPHCGAYIDGTETDRAGRLLDLLTAEVTRRAQLLAMGGHAALHEQRSAAAPADRLPYLVLLVDQYEAFHARHAEADSGQLVERLDGLLRRGAAVGILVALTTDRSGFTHRLGSAAATRLVLRQAEPDDVAIFGADPRAMPRVMPPGRAMVVPDGTQVQLALLTPDPGGAAQSAAVAELAGRLHARWAGLDPLARPRRVDRLPTSITSAELAGLPAAPTPRTPAMCTVGAGGDELGRVDIDLADAGAAFLISGPPRSGRSTALAAIVSSLAGRETGELGVLLCCPRPSPLLDLAGLPGIVGVLRGSALDVEIDAAIAAAPGPLAVVVDDAERLGDGIAADVLDRFLRTARDDGNLVIAAGTTDELALHNYRGWLATLRHARTGLLLNPASHVDGEVLGVKLPRSTAGGWPPGRALLAQRGRSVAVQVPQDISRANPVARLNALAG